MAHPSASKTVSVPEAIQQIIKSAKEVREYKEECEAISQRLARLKDKLYGSNDQLRHELGTVKVEKVVNSLVRTLPSVRSLVNQCQNPNTTLKGANKFHAVRTLERELDRIKYSLTGYEADLTADLQEKKDILSSTLSEKQRIDRYRRDAQNAERARLMLELIGAETAIATEETFSELSEKYKKIIADYLNACAHALTGISVVGLEAGTENFITNVYPTSLPKSPPTNGSELREIQLPVESIYIHLKADHSTTFEREQARQLISKDEEYDKNTQDEHDRALWEKLGSAPIMEFLIEKDHTYKKKENDENSNFREILQNNRWIVMLGDPGCGKTTFVRWLVSRYIDAIRRGEQTVSSDFKNQYQQNKNNDKNESYMIGLIRMPILIRVGEFVEALGLKKNNLTLFDYIGYHTWMGNLMVHLTDVHDKKQRESLSRQLQEALQQYVLQGCALIVLDGLDEISDLDTRTLVVRLVEDFVGLYVQTPDNISVFDDQFIRRELDIPSKTGGNQLIITSRIVGYQARPLSGQFSHYTILPMTMDDIKKFVDHWFLTVHRKMIEALRLYISQDTMEKGCENQTSVLKEELEKPGNDGLRLLASNPCLLNFICLISFQERNTKLPSERICLYDKLAKSMLKLWSIKDPNGLLANSNTVERLLCDIATYIHENSSSGLIETSNLKMVCLKSLEPYNGRESETKREKDAQDCIDKFQNNAGILIARGQQLYSFLHLTLQEYYTCKKMVTIMKDKGRAQKLAEIFQKRITDPRFRIPLTLALGWVSWKWEQKEIDEFCEKLFASENQMSQYFPLEILMFVTSIGELKKLPSKDQIFTAFTRLLLVSARNNWHKNYPDLEKRMAFGLLKLSGILIEEWITRILSSKESTIECITALCTLLQECKRLVQSEGNEENRELLKEWTNREVCKVLSKCLFNDTIDNQFVFDAVLAQAAISNPIALPSNNLRKFFLENPDSLTKLSLSMLAAVIALYGGLMLSGNKQNGKTNTRYDENNMVTSVDFGVVFLPQCMHRKSPLTAFLIECILAELADNGERSRTALVDRIRQKAEQISLDDQSLEAVDTFILMFCIVGVDKIWLYKSFIRHEAFHQAIDRFKRICNYLRQFYFVPEIYDKYRNITSSKDSLLSNYDSFNENIYKKYTINRDSTELINQFMIWYNLIGKTDQKLSSNNVEALFVFIDSICRGRSRLCTSSRTSLTNKWICKTDQRLLLLPDVFQKEENLQQLLGHPFTEQSLSNLSFPMFLRTLWTFDDYHHGADMSNVTIEKAESSMILAYDRNHCFALAFVQKHLQLLFSRAINGGHILLNPRTKNQKLAMKSAYTLSFAHVLCSSILSVCNFPITYACQSALITLLPLSRIYRLESLILALLGWTKKTSELDPGAVKWYFEEMQRSTDAEHFSYTDGYKTLTKVNRIEISDETEANGLTQAVDKEARRLQSALDLLKSDKSEERGNVEVFSASVCLGYLGWITKSAEDLNLFKKAIKAASKITNPLVRLDALNVLASCPILLSSQQIFQDLSDVRVTLNKLLEETFSELPSDLTPLLSVSLLSQYISLVGANDKSINRIHHILEQTKEFKDEDDRGAVCVALGPFMTLSPELPIRLLQFMQEFRTSSILARTQVLRFDSPILRCFAERSEQTANTPPFLHNHDHSQSISVLYACLYLVNLSSDVQKLTIWLADSQRTEINISHLLNWQVDRSQQKRLLTYSHIVGIEKKLESLSSSRSITNELISLEKELFDFHKCEPSARPFLMKWLKYTTDSPRYLFACHAALISVRSDIWTKRNANVICDLLESHNDRFRQEAECLLHIKDRNSSELGWNVLHTFIERFVSYETQSTHASLALSWLFEKLTIDATEHLDGIIQWENQRMEINTKQTKGTEDSSLSAEQQNFLTNPSPIARWFIHLAPQVLKHFTDYLQSVIKDLKEKQKTGLKLKGSRRRFIFGWCARILTVDTNDISKILTILTNILNGNFSPELQCSAAFAIGHNRTSDAQKILLDVITSESKRNVARSTKVLAICIHAYCWSCYLAKTKNKKNTEEEDHDDNDDDKKKKDKTDETDNMIESLCLEMLKHDSPIVQMAASIELAKVCLDVKKLLGFFNHDSEHCYKSLIKVRFDQSFTDPRKKHSKCLVNLIKAHSDLLKVFIIDLYGNIAGFDVYLEPYSDWSEDFGDTFLVSVACDLVEEMPAAFFNEVQLSSDTENLKKALLNTSKQHNYVQRNACMKLISTFGDFTVDICKIFINAAMENPSTQTASYESIKRFRKPFAFSKLEMAVQQLDRVLKQLESNAKQSKSPSLPLTSVLQELKQTVQMNILSARNCIKQALEQLDVDLNKLKRDQQQLKLDLEALKKNLIELEPIFEQWEPALNRLIKYLKSQSLNKRWMAARFLERLVQCNIISAQHVQGLINKTIKDSTSNAELWLPKNDDVQSFYECAGSLSQMLCRLMMRMVLVDETSSEIKVIQVKNRLLEDFDIAETSAQLASCITIDEDLSVIENDCRDFELSDTEEMTNSDIEENFSKESDQQRNNFNNRVRPN